MDLPAQPGPGHHGRRRLHRTLARITPPPLSSERRRFRYVGPSGAASPSLLGPTALEGTLMLRWALIFLVLALVAGALGAGGVANVSMNIAYVLFVIFIIL